MFRLESIVVTFLNLPFLEAGKNYSHKLYVKNF